MAMQVLNMLPTSSCKLVWKFIEEGQEHFAVIVTEPRSLYANLLKAVGKMGCGYVELLLRYQDVLDSQGVFIPVIEQQSAARLAASMGQYSYLFGQSERLIELTCDGMELAQFTFRLRPVNLTYNQEVLRNAFGLLRGRSGDAGQRVETESVIELQGGSWIMAMGGHWPKHRKRYWVVHPLER